jgi:hypothetical protein
MTGSATPPTSSHALPDYRACEAESGDEQLVQDGVAACPELALSIDDD